MLNPPLKAYSRSSPGGSRHQQRNSNISPMDLNTVEDLTTEHWEKVRLLIAADYFADIHGAAAKPQILSVPFSCPNTFRNLVLQQLNVIALPLQATFYEVEGILHFYLIGPNPKPRSETPPSRSYSKPFAD